MASMKLWGVFTVLFMVTGNHVSKTTDLSRQMMLVPSFLRQAATPVFFAAGNDRQREHFRPMTIESLAHSEDKSPLHQTRPTALHAVRPPLSLLQQMDRNSHRQPFDIRTAAATPERQPFANPLSQMRSVPPTFFIEDEVPFPFEVPPRHFQQANLHNSPQHFRPTMHLAARHPARHFEQTNLEQMPQKFRLTSSSPQRSPTATSAQSSEETFRSEVGSLARHPTTTSSQSSEENVNQKVSPAARRPTTTEPWSSKKTFQQKARTTERRPMPTLPHSSEESFRQREQQLAKRPTTNLPQSSEETFRHRKRPTTFLSKQPTTIFPHSSEEIFQHRVPTSAIRVLPSVLDSVHESSISTFIPGEAGKDYPLFGEVPRTGFTCTEPMISNFVADEETHCQVVRVCREDGGVDNFLCPNGTLFDDESQFCNWWYRVPCRENANSNQIPHRGRTVSQAERENHFRPRPEIIEPQHQPQRPSSNGRDQNTGTIDHGLDGFFSQHQQPHQARPISGGFGVSANLRAQEDRDFFRENLDDFFGHPRLVDFRQSQIESHEMTVPGKVRPLLPPLTTITSTTSFPRTTKKLVQTLRTRKPSSTRAPSKVETIHVDQSDPDGEPIGFGFAEDNDSTNRPIQKQRTRRPSRTRGPTVNHQNIHQEDQSGLAEKSISTNRPIPKPRTRRPPSTRAPKVTHDNIATVHEDQSNVESNGGFGLAEKGVRLTTRRPILKVRSRGRARLKPKPQQIQVTHQTETTSSKGEFDPFFDEQSRDLETTTVTDPTTTTTKRKLNSRRTTTKKPSTTRRTTRKTTKLTPSTIRFRHRSTKKPRKPLTAKPSTTTTEEAIVSNDSNLLPVTTSVSEIERPIPRKLDNFQDIEPFTHDPFGNLRPEIPVQGSPFNPQMPVNFDSFYFGPVVASGFPRSEMNLDELPIAGALPEDTVASILDDIPTTTTKIHVAATPTKLRASPKRGKSSRKNQVSTSTFASERKPTSDASAGHSRSKWRSQKTNATVVPPSESDLVPTSTVRMFATPRSRAQLFRARQSLMKKTTFGQKQVEISTLASETVAAQEANTISVIENTPVIITPTEDNTGVIVT